MSKEIKIPKMSEKSKISKMRVKSFRKFRSF